MLHTAPILRLLIPFAVGILFAIHLPFASSIVLLFFILQCVVFSFLTFIKRWRLTYGKIWWQGLLINTVFLTAGYELTILKTDLFFHAHVSSVDPVPSFACARIAAPCTEKEKSVKTIVELISIKQYGITRPVFGKSIVYFQKDKRSLNLKYGDEIFLNSSFHHINDTRNPGEFDYQRFMFYKNVYRQAYVKRTGWVYTGKNTGNLFVSYSLRLRDQLMVVLNHAVLKEEFAVAAALMIGYTDKLDATLMANYSQAGVLHVLSVSGLHVGIVFVVFNWLLFFFERIRYGTIFKTGVLISFLWFYALLTGLSPSVLRAATMFSFIVLAKQLHRNSSIYNTLAASAFILLLYHPHMIMDVGFQLSYLAVAGIFFIEPLLSKNRKHDNWVVHQIVSLISVSIAAQLATLPISLYYFHQFPSFFLFANLLVIPLSTMIIYTGIVLIFFSFNNFLSTYLSVFFSKMVSLMNYMVMVIHRLPYAVIDGIFISVTQAVFLYGCIVFLILYISKKKLVFFKSMLLSIIGFLVFQCHQQKQQLNQKKWIVYNKPHKQVIEFIHGKEHALLTDNEAIKRMNCIFISDDIVQFFNKRFIRIKTAEKIKKHLNQQDKIVVDVIIVSNDAAIQMKELIKIYRTSLIVFDSSNGSSSLKKWKKECMELRQPFYCVKESGAFVGTL